MTFLTIPDTSSRHNVDLPQPGSSNGAVPPPGPQTPHAVSGDKTKARAILAAICTLQAIEQAQQPATPDERQVLLGFPGFGPVALGIFPDPVTGQYKDTTWQTLGEELRTLLTPEDYASARHTTFTAFYTSPVVIQAMHAALRHQGVPAEATVLEPGCGIGNFIALAPTSMRFIGVELDSISGRIARVLHPGHDIRIEHFRDTRVPEDRIDAVIGNVPFADLRLDYHGTRLALHDFFLAKSLDVLKPGGVLALVTSHYTLDKRPPGLRTQLAQLADFLGAIRLVAYLHAADKYCRPLPWRLRRRNALVIRSRNPCARPPLAPLACLCTPLSRATACASPGTVAETVYGWGHGGTRYQRTSRTLHT